MPDLTRVVLVCLIVATAGCGAGSFEPSAPSPTEPAVTQTPQTEPATQTQTGTRTPTTTPAPEPVAEPVPTVTEPLNYTDQFKLLAYNESVNVTNFNYSYDGFDYVPSESYTVQSVTTEPAADRNRQLVVRATVRNDTVNATLKPLVNLPAVYGVVTRRALANGDDWDISQLTIEIETPNRTISSRIESRYAVATADDMTLANLTSQVSTRTYQLQSRPQNGSFGFVPDFLDPVNRTQIDQFENELARLTDSTNITDVTVQQSGQYVFITYVHTAPLNDSVTRARELLRVVRMYGEATNRHDFGFAGNDSWNSFAVIETVHRDENGTYDSRISAAVRADQAREYVAGNYTQAGFIRELSDGRYLKNELGQ
jgi:hypothetical protein